jgi:uncharacterized repeat protein (TIGR01451 family)
MAQNIFNVPRALLFATSRIFSLMLFNLTTKGETDMDFRKSLQLILALAFLAPAMVVAQPQVTVNMTAEKEVVEKVAGKAVKKRVPAKSTNPGETLIFTLQYKNQGNEKATNVKVDNPIPKDTVYIVGSGIGKNSKMLFSIDGGKTYKEPSLLTYEETLPGGKKVKKQASPEQYTHVRWVIDEILPGKEGKVGFQVRVK